MKIHKIEIEKVLRQDVKEIIDSREKSKIIHHTGDIDASGDEVEETVRRVIRRKLPLKYYVSQGHIVDEALSTSKQLDIIICDNSGSPILFSTENGTEYFPYESIYGFGEIKSTYYANKKYLQDFIASTKLVYDNLKRKNTSPAHITQDIVMKGVQSSDKRPYKNPLFKFMIFVNSNDFAVNQISEILKETDDKYLPNIICLLDKGIIIKSKVEKQNDGYLLKNTTFHPEFILENERDDFEWSILQLGSGMNHSAANFGYLINALNSHLKECLVLRPQIQKYYEQLFTYEGQIIK